MVKPRVESKLKRNETPQPPYNLLLDHPSVKLATPISEDNTKPTENSLLVHLAATKLTLNLPAGGELYLEEKDTVRWGSMGFELTCTRQEDFQLYQ
ncbi:hypothetical protein LguiA_031288 [Lonicera macranthoides]